jgi:molybdate/tungstate transport system substrate-binding protein
MRTTKTSAVSGTVIAAVIVALAVIVAAAYEVSTISSSTTTSTSTPVSTSAVVTATVTSTSTSINTVTTTTTSAALAPLVSYSADAYSAETTALLAGFSKSTGIPVAPVVSGGSNADASSISAGAPDDVFVSAALSATAPAHLGSLSSNWAIGIASDQMVLAYSNATLANSAASAMISQGQNAASSNATSDWNSFFTSLTSGSVKVGISSPVADPAGLRAWLVLEAAGYLYSGGNEQAFASSLLKSESNVTASSAANLVAPLQSGQIQFLFIYESAAITDGLGYLSLSTHVNLSSPGLAGFYSRFSYTDSAGKTAGAPIVIVVTVPLSSVNMAEALQFVQYAVKNMASLSSYGLVVPPTALLYSSVTAPQSLPQPIQLMLSQGLLVQAGPI